MNARIVPGWLFVAGRFSGFQIKLSGLRHGGI
jgi:hypothetical protein